MPNSSAMAFGRNSARLVVSYVATDNETPASLSPLWRDLPSTGLDALLPRPLDHYLPLRAMRRRLRDTVAWEQYLPGRVPALEESEPVAGGASILGNQAACPFRAMVRHRLRLEALPADYLGSVRRTGAHWCIAHSICSGDGSNPCSNYWRWMSRNVRHCVARSPNTV